METCGAVLAVAFILNTQMCAIVDSVSCFNCASTEHPGCGENLDLPLLVKSSTASLPSDKKRGVADSVSPEIPEIRQGSSRKTSAVSHDGRLASLSPEDNPNNKSRDFDFNKVVVDSRKSRRVNLMIDNINTNGSLNGGSDQTSSRELLAFNDDSTSEFSTPKSEINGRDRPIEADSGSDETGVGAIRDNSTTMPETDVNGRWRLDEDRRADFPASHLMVECPGKTCLIQRISTTSGNVFVRTCDVSSRVPIGQCHVVTNVLGASVSVVCVCEGHFCNENNAGSSVFVGKGEHGISTTVISVVATWIIFRML